MIAGNKPLLTWILSTASALDLGITPQLQTRKKQTPV